MFTSVKAHLEFAWPSRRELTASVGACARPCAQYPGCTVPNGKRRAPL